MEETDLDLAIALSLVEAETQFSRSQSKGKNEEENEDLTISMYLRDKISVNSSIDSKALPGKDYLDNDFALAVKLQQEENNKSKSHQPNIVKPPMNEKDPNQNSFGIYDYIKNTCKRNHSNMMTSTPNSNLSCANCNNPIAFGTYITAMGKVYHSECFKCDGCNVVISQTQFKVHGDNPYHSECYNELFSPRCVLCTNVMSGQYKRHPFFENEIYCVNHEDNTRQCFSCNRREPLQSSGKENFHLLTDGRMICPICVSTAIFDSVEAKTLYLEAVDFIEKTLGLSIPAGMRDVPVLAVDIPTLNENKDHGIQQHHRNGDDFRRSTTRGLTISSTNEIRHYSPGTFTFSPQFGIRMIEPSVMRIEEYREVTAVLVLAILPRDLACSILAHEAMHVWMRLRRDMPTNISPPVEEGLCQYVAMKYLEKREDDQSDTRFVNGISYSQEKQLRAFFRSSIETDPSPVYGDGFRKCADCCRECSLEYVLGYVKARREFPETGNSLYRDHFT
jgi:hypothetical protein